LELQSRLAGPLGHRRDPPVVGESVPIEDDALDVRRLRLLRHQLANQAARRHLVEPLEAIANLLAQGRREGESLTRGVVHDLGVDVLVALEDREAGPLHGPGDLLPNSLRPALARGELALVHSCHHRYPFTPQAPVLPCFRRMVSSAYLMPLPLYGSGGRSERTLSATSPRSCLSWLESVTTVCRSTAAVTPSGRGKTTGWESPRVRCSSLPLTSAR